MKFLFTLWSVRPKNRRTPSPHVDVVKSDSKIMFLGLGVSGLRIENFRSQILRNPQETEGPSPVGFVIKI